MDALSLSHSIFSTHPSFRRINPVTTILHTRRIHVQNGFFRFLVHAKQFDFQDFQGYAKPSRLLPASEVKVPADTLIENISLSLEEEESRSVFVVKLGTSNIYGSSLSNLNAGILLCLIDENGDSILQRISPCLMIDHTKESGDVVGTDMMLHFQKGSVNEFAFEGPQMGGVQALWISVDSGQWRLGSVCLTVINYERQPMLKEKDGLHKYIGFQYDFCVEDILLGEGSDTSMAELKPCLVTELSSIDPFAFFSKVLPDSTLYPNPMISNEQSMKEYADLKFSLLLYDGMLIFIGTSIAFFSAGESAGLDFLMGGIGGFLYLLLLQRSVDGLPPPESFATNTRENDQMFKAIKGPISTLAWVIGFALFAVKYNSGDLPVMLTPKDLIVGMMGFLACKVSVVLAAVKPLPVGLKSTK